MKRAFSLVEVLLATVLSAILLGSLLGMYLFLAKRTDESLRRSTAYMQASQLLREIESQVASADAVVVSSNAFGSTLKCLLYSNATDNDGDGYPDKFALAQTTNSGKAKYGRGKRVYYFTSDTTGAFSASNTGGRATCIWRAWRLDDTTPATGDRDASFALQGATPKYDRVYLVVFTNDATAGSVTVTISATQKTTSGNAAPLVLKRTIYYKKAEY